MDGDGDADLDGDGDGDVDNDGDADDFDAGACDDFAVDLMRLACVGSLDVDTDGLSGPGSAGCRACHVLPPALSTFSWAIVAGSNLTLGLADIGGTGSAVSMCF